MSTTTTMVAAPKVVKRRPSMWGKLKSFKFGESKDAVQPTIVTVAATPTSEKNFRFVQDTPLDLYNIDESPMHERAQMSWNKVRQPSVTPSMHSDSDTRKASLAAPRRPSWFHSSNPDSDDPPSMPTLPSDEQIRKLSQFSVGNVSDGGSAQSTRRPSYTPTNAAGSFMRTATAMSGEPRDTTRRGSAGGAGSTDRRGSLPRNSISGQSGRGSISGQGGRSSIGGQGGRGSISGATPTGRTRGSISGPSSASVKFDEKNTMTVHASPATAPDAPIQARAAASASIKYDDQSPAATSPPAKYDDQNTSFFPIGPVTPPAVENNGRRPSYVPRSAATGFLRSVTGIETESTKKRTKSVVTKSEPELMAQAKQVAVQPALKLPQDYAQWRSMQTAQAPRQVPRMPSVDKLAKHKMQSLAGICDIDEDYLFPVPEKQQSQVSVSPISVSPVSSTFGNYSMTQPRGGEKRPSSTVSAANSSFSSSSTLYDAESPGLTSYTKRVDSAFGPAPSLRSQMSLEDLDFRGAMMAA